MKLELNTEFILNVFDKTKCVVIPFRVICIEVVIEWYFAGADLVLGLVARATHEKSRRAVKFYVKNQFFRFDASSNMEYGSTGLFIDDDVVNYVE